MRATKVKRRFPPNLLGPTTPLDRMRVAWSRATRQERSSFIQGVLSAESLSEALRSFDTAESSVSERCNARRRNR